MNGKYAKVIEYLKNQNSIRNSKEIAAALNLSQRTVKNYVSHINLLDKEDIIISTRQGYKINRSIDINHLLDQSKSIPISIDERSNYIMHQIISHQTDEDINIYALCEYMFISYSTLKKVISHLNQKFESYDVKLITKNNIIKLNGTEQNKRKVISTAIYENISGNLLSITTLQEHFSNLDVQGIEQIISKICSNNKLLINDFAK
ncbi:MAG: helix-turn-helix domain-containing protein, partial [Bacilli bacterium]